MRKLFCSLILAGGLLAGCTDTTGDVIPVSVDNNPGLPFGPATLTQIQKGRYLVTTAGCGGCHNRGTTDPTDPNWLAGYINNATINPQNQGTFDIGPNHIFARNLTPDKDTGLGTWTDQQIFDALRKGVDDEGDLLAPPMPWPEYQNMTDEDTWAIVAYLRSLKAVRNAVPENDNGMGGTVDTSTFYPVAPPKVPAYPAANEFEVTNTVGDGLPLGPATRAQVLRGRYLVTSATDCNACHSVHGNDPGDSLYLGGYVADWGINPQQTGTFQVGPVTTFARNLTPDATTGLGAVSNQDIYDALHDGVDPHDGSVLKPPMPWPEYHNFTSADTWSIVAYLRSLRPVSNDVPDDVVPPGFPGFNTQPIPLPAYPAGNEIP